MSKFHEFMNKYKGIPVDVDGAYGEQCVDLFNAWNRDYNNCYINCRPSGYAKSLAENKLNNGILNYFKETPINNMIEGTVVVWGNCKSCPNSHVGFFVKDNGNGTFQCFQQNVQGKNYPIISNMKYEGIIGAFIPNQLLCEDNHKSTIEIANEVIAGKWGNGEERRNRLTQAGYDYQTIQNEVNRIVKGSNNLKSTEEIAREVIAGKWGNGSVRKERLTQAGYNYNEIQSIVNRILK